MARNGEQGQQAGSKRPAERTGAAKKAPKSGGMSASGTAEPGRAKKSVPGKAGGMRPAKSKKPSRKD